MWIELGLTIFLVGGVVTSAVGIELIIFELELGLS